MNKAVAVRKASGKLGAKPVPGFTLLEMVFVLAIVAILVSWLTLSIGTVEREEELRRASSDITTLVKRGRSIAVGQQRAYQLRIREDTVTMEPVNQRSDEDNRFENLEENSESGELDAITVTEETDPDVKLEIKRWQSEQWVVIEGDREVTLKLDPNGLVEPLSIRCSIGKSWLIQELHPLTADIRDEQMSIEKE